MTPTTTEREAREILGREYQKAHAADPRINFCEPEFEVAVRAVMAALTREQREQEAPGAVAYARCKHDRWADQCLRCNPQATPPAPVDVRVAELIAADKEYDEAASYAAYVKDPVGNGARKAAATKRRAAALALLDGQPAGVVIDDEAVTRLDDYLWREHGVCLGRSALRAALQAALGGGVR